MNAFPAFVIATAACAFLLVGCGAASGSASSAVPDTVHWESTAPPAATPTVAPTPDPTAAPAAEEAPTAAPVPTPQEEASSGEEEILFDTDAADYSGAVAKMTDRGFLLSPTVVSAPGGDTGTAVMAEAGTASRFSVICTEDTRYIAVYADGNGNSSQTEGTVDMVRENAFVYITGSKTDGGFTADAVAILNP